MTTLSTTELHARLRAAAAGSYPHESACELLIAHGNWLRRADFLDACTEAFDGFDGRRDVPMVGIDWHAVPTFVEGVGCAGSERRMLLFGAELAGVGTGETLDELLSSLDEHNIRIVLDAVARHAGWHERRLTHTVTGYRGSAPR